MASVPTTNTGQLNISQTAGPNSKYDYSQTKYPQELNMDNQPYMVIRINQLVGSKFESSYGTTQANITPNRGTLVGLGLSKNATDGAAALEGGVGGVIAGGAGSVLGLLKGSGIKAVATGSAGGAVTEGVGARLATAVAPSTTRATSRIAQEIVLYMPNQVGFDYKTSWGDAETTAFGAAANAVSQAESYEKSHGKASGVGQIAKVVYDAVGNAATNGQSGSTTGNAVNQITAMAALKASPALSNMTGLAVNPRMEKVFHGVNFRVFTFNFEFGPRNAAEFQEVLNILYLLRFHMMPEFVSPGEFLYLYPSEFDIRFFMGPNENTNIPRIGTCALTNVSINFTPDRVWKQIANGDIPRIDMQVEFTELGLMSKEVIQQGY